MKFTQYFLHTRQRPDRAKIKLEWIQSVLEHPLKIETQDDGRIKKWGYISEEKKFLRVVLLEDKMTIHNAFFDRNFKEVENEG